MEIGMTILWSNIRNNASVSSSYAPSMDLLPKLIGATFTAGVDAFIVVI
jgi:hypothetical protein